MHSSMFNIFVFPFCVSLQRLVHILFVKYYRHTGSIPTVQKGSVQAKREKSIKEREVFYYIPLTSETESLCEWEAALLGKCHYPSIDSIHSCVYCLICFDVFLRSVLEICIF